MYDTFHFREDSSQRNKLTERIGHHIAEHIANKVPESRFEEIHRKYPYSEKGKTFIPVIYQRAIGDAEAGKRASKVKAELASWTLVTLTIGRPRRRQPCRRCAIVLPLKKW